MASLIIRKLTASIVNIEDLGISLTGAIGTTFDLLSEQANDVSLSTDLVAAINGTAPFTVAEIEILDPRDGTTLLSTADALLVVANHNLSHFGISGGRFGTLDAPATSPTNNFLVEYDIGSDVFVQINPTSVINNNSAAVSTITAGMGVDGTNSTFSFDPLATVLVRNNNETNYDAVLPNGTFVGGDGVGGTAYAVSNTITLSDGSIITVDAVDVNGDVTAFTVTTSGLTNVTAGVALTQSSTSGTGLAFTLTPQNNNISDGAMKWSVKDAFLLNTGDTLDSGTLTIASGAAVDFPTGSSITIAGDVTAATITTPAGGFANASDLINKFYVDSVAQGLDWKESVRFATTPAEGDLTGTYVNNGGVGDTITYNSTIVTIDGISYTGVSTTGLAVGDRVLVKDQTLAVQNGIYVVTAGSTAIATVLTRATDQDGSPANEVSGGNSTFVEATAGLGGTINENTVWSVVHDGVLTLNTNTVDWTQTAGPGTVLDGIGISKSANTIDLNVADLVTATPIITDLLAFHDADGTAEASGSKTRSVSFQNLFNTLNVANNIPGTGVVIKTAEGSPDTYATRSIVASILEDEDGLIVTNGDGVAANPSIGLDVLGMTASPTNMAGTDEFPTHDKSEGTAGANRKMTGQQIADGVDTILNLGGLTISTINGQLIATIVDTTRTNKALSIDSNNYLFSDNDLDHLSWVSVGDAVDADSGHIMPLNGTIVMVTAHCEDTATAATKALHIFLDGVDKGTIGTVGPGANTEIVNTTVNLDFIQGEKLRIQAQNGVAGRVRDTVVDVLVRWRA